MQLPTCLLLDGHYSRGGRQEGEYQWMHYQFGWFHESGPREITFTGVEDGPSAF